MSVGKNEARIIHDMKKRRNKRNRIETRSYKGGKLRERRMINNSGTMKLQQKTPFEQYTYYTYFTDDKN
jgi:hypothetical protein